ncbi:hypothetical protein ACIQV3_31370 [Streptomyces sp. NPDC099050]|uniref:hypothetical protein n=1 Tax=Streptomyces sp. NPDC099050 TaxID=3366100 RepID=UPI0038165013
MLARRHHTPPTAPARDATVAILTGFWFEALCYADAYAAQRPELLDRAMLDTPEEAVRLIRVQIRTTHRS